MTNDINTGLIEPEIENSTEVGLPFMVILFNDNTHIFDDVILQLIKALECSLEDAKSYAFEAHIKGKSVIFSG